MTTRTGRPPAPDTVEKAMRYLTTGRVRVTHADHDTVTAQVRGSSNLPYEVMGSPALWACSCPANRFGSRRCAHILAVQAVWAPAAEHA